MLTAEEEAKSKKVEDSRKFIKSVNVVSSDSEGHSDTGSNKNKKITSIKNQKSDLPVVSEKKAKKVKYYKG